MSEQPPAREQQPTPALPFALQSQERVVMFIRRHPVHLIATLVWYAVLAVVPIVALTWIAGASSGLGSTFGRIALLLDLVWLVFWLVKAYFAWFRWVNDIWVVTNQRIVDSLKENWFNHRMASADLVDVEDMTVQRSGLLQTMFRFGDVRCQTAGAQPNFVLAGISNPGQALAVVDASRDAARRELGRPA